MKERLQLASNIGLFLLAVLILGTIQSSLWFQIFSYFPSPAFWIPALVYVAINRSTLETVLFSYLAAFVLSTMTAMPEGMLMIICLALSLSTQLFKQRFYWSSSSYFMMTCGLASFIFHLYHWGAASLMTDQPLASPQFSDWLIEALLTPLIAPPLWPVFQWFDRLTNRELAPEASASMT